VSDAAVVRDRRIAMLPLAARCLTVLLLFPTRLSVPSPCDNALPVSLLETVRRVHPGSQIVTLDLLSDGDRKFYVGQNVKGCPGVASGDFFGDGTTAYAILLRRPLGKRWEVSLVVARPQQSPNRERGSWTLNVLETMKGMPREAGAPVVVPVPKGDYTDVDGKKTLKSSHVTFALVKYEASTIVYVWEGSHFEKVWVQD
jgi:hypothetical protein